MSIEDKTLKEKINGALNNEDLQKGLKKSVKNFKTHRKEALDGLDFKKVQQNIKAIKEKNLAILEDNIKLFEKACEKSGIKFLETKGPDDTRNLVYDIISKHSGKKVVKGKSLVTDEIELNQFLESKGIKSIETDLGEWLIQLAGEKPSHITAPAIHMSKERIANLLNEMFNVNLPPDPKQITTFARKKLRQEFIDADVGITGANILVAKTGSVIIVTNEGNGRLVSTLPNVHIVITTPEKIVTTMQDATEILDILPKSSVGQPISSYVSIISGPSKTADIEKELVFGVHGPEFVYVILMDNGRKALLKNNDFNEVLNCIKCGACLGMCPVYQAVGGHVFGRHYIGGVGAVLTAFIENFDATEDLAKLCSGCGICKNICPANIDIPQMVLKLKEYLYANRKVSLTKEMIVKGLFSNKGIFETSL
ncbi:MAG: LUD domain-containing protein, partial [Vampirovibrionia bacterium]